MLPQTHEDAIEAFYSKPFQFSYSSLNKLLWNPAAFYQMYVLGLREEMTESYIVQGKVIHTLLLEPERFDDQYIVSPSKLPSDNIKVIIDRVFQHHTELAAQGDKRDLLGQFAPAIIDIMADMNFYQSLKTDQQRLEKVITEESILYWSFLKSRTGKTLVAYDTIEYCKNAVEIVKSNQEVCDLLGYGTTSFDLKDIHNEQYMEIKQLGDRPFGLKGILDNLVIDHEKKIIYINDVKTTSKDLVNFPDSIEAFSYWMQAAIYFTMVTTEYKSLIEQGYNVEFRFIAIDRMFHTYAFPVSTATMEKWVDKLFVQLDKAHWHYENRAYGLPYDLDNKLVVL